MRMPVGEPARPRSTRPYGVTARWGVVTPYDRSTDTEAWLSLRPVIVPLSRLTLMLVMHVIGTTARRWPEQVHVRRHQGRRITVVLILPVGIGVRIPGRWSMKGHIQESSQFLSTTGGSCLSSAGSRGRPLTGEDLMMDVVIGPMAASASSSSSRCLVSRTTTFRIQQSSPTT
jgi:hypothetical protein